MIYIDAEWQIYSKTSVSPMNLSCFAAGNWEKMQNRIYLSTDENWIARSPFHICLSLETWWKSMRLSVLEPLFVPVPDAFVCLLFSPQPIPRARLSQSLRCSTVFYSCVRAFDDNNIREINGKLLNCIGQRMGIKYYAVGMKFADSSMAHVCRPESQTSSSFQLWYIFRSF